ncbi:hypothetical protein DXG03_008348 [Asterophora parasitica]|uniref:HECT-type E3 ubiquitin transferase n=1 Tax=Asterophora parasitica TaxID=117018 RepID=A0A9P7G7Q4_9AGAR|nr:hypothetical protein DXG03_008348 [Asterophora parasitica]
MFTPFPDERKRKINLGGTSSAQTASALLDKTKAAREERLEQQRRQKTAVQIQAWWHGVKEARRVRIKMRGAFEDDVEGLVGLRYLAVVGRKDEEALGLWAGRMAAGGPDALFGLARQPQVQPSWLVLIRQVAFLLLQSVSSAPLSPHAMSHLSVLNALLSPSTTSQVLGSPQVSSSITAYLLQRDLYALLSGSIKSIRPEARSSLALPLLIQLVVFPFETFDPASPEFKAILTSTLTRVLTILLLPNRIPIASLTLLSAQIPFAHLSSLDTSLESILTSTTQAEKLHLVANLQVFVPPRYKLLPLPSLHTYFRFLTGLLNALPVGTLNPLPKKSKSKDAYESNDDESVRVEVVTTFSVPSNQPPPDPRTLARLRTLASPAHLSSVLSMPLHGPTVPLLHTLAVVYPSEVPRHILALRPALVREVYRGWVRGGGLGGDVNGFHGGEEKWAAMLLLVELYTQAMLTMGDDEFFGDGSSARNSSKTTNVTTAPLARNPLTLDELVEWSRQLRNIAFALYWRGDDQAALGALVGGEVRCTWESIRERVTRCLVGIHARDSRKPFVPPDHWLVTSQIDVNSFVEAAIFEERELSARADSDPDSSPRTSRAQGHHTTRQLAYLSPRLGVLNNIPFTIPFDVRVSIFRHFVLNDVVSITGASNSRVAARSMFWGSGNGRTRVQVRRGSVAQDGFDRLAEANLKQPVEISFIDQFGAEEAGIDGGGVFKEFFTSLCKEVFDTDRGLWLANKKNELYPNPHAYATEAHSLNWYRFIGRILGKAMYEGILVDVAFAGFFLAKWLGRQSFLDDLASLDPDLYSGLIFLKHYTGNPEDLALNFTIAVDGVPKFGDTKTIDLVPNGSNIAVTRENRLQYIQLVSHYRLTRQIRLQSEAFFEGLSEMIDPKWIRMFNQQEIQILLGGVNAPIDFDDLRQHTNYGGLYDDHEETVVAFWNVVNTFDQEQRMALLRFVTSCSRPPLLGFKELVPNFSIRDSSADQQRLPTASTCVNLLKLPRYKSEKQLRDKLLQAITSNAGFDLS